MTASLSPARTLDDPDEQHHTLVERTACGDAVPSSRLVHVAGWVAVVERREHGEEDVAAAAEGVGTQPGVWLWLDGSGHGTRSYPWRW